LLAKKITVVLVLDCARLGSTDEDEQEQEHEDEYEYEYEDE
jgi:hypothetical protein